MTKPPSLSQRSIVEQERLMAELRARRADTKHRPAKIEPNHRFEAPRKNVRKAGDHAKAGDACSTPVIRWPR